MRLSFRLTVIACYAGALVSVGCASREETQALSALDRGCGHGGEHTVRPRAA